MINYRQYRRMHMKKINHAPTHRINKEQNTNYSHKTNLFLCIKITCTVSIVVAKTWMT